MLLSHMYNGSKIRMRKNGANQGTTNYSSGISNSSQPMYLAVSPYYSGSLADYMDGDIAEVIVFNDNHNAVERILVQNYLGAKYGLSVSNRRYDFSSTHGHDVMGIGKKNSNEVTSAKGQGILEIKNASSLDSDDYLLLGHNNGDLTAKYDDAPAEYTYRINRSWRSDMTNDVGTVTITIDLDGLGFPTDANEFGLLIDDNGDFSDASVHTTGVSYSGTEVSFTGVDINYGDYISLGIYSSITWDGTQFEHGSGSSNEPNSSDGDRKFYVSGASGSLTADAEVYSMVVSGTGNITLNSNSELTVNNNIQNDGVINVSDGAGLNQAHSGANENSGTGTYNIDRVGLGTINGYNGISSPVSDANIISTFPNNNPCDMFLFNGEIQKWKYDYTAGYTTTCLGNSVTFSATDLIGGADGILNVAAGYFIPGYSTPSKTFSGTANNGDISVPVYVENNPNNVNWTGDDWNLIGNPYPGAISATAFWNENAVNNSRITNAIYYWEDDATSGSGYNQNDDYASWNLLGGTSSSNSSEIPNGYISSCQGFWVIADANTDIVFNNSMRGGTNTQFFKAENNIADARFWFSVENDAGNYNQLLVGFTDEATLGVDKAYDAIKQNGNPDMYMGTVINEEVYAIQGLPNLAESESHEIPLELFSSSAGLHTFKMDSIENNSSSYSLVLVDKIKQKTHDIENGIATIYLDTAGTYKNRFYLAVTREDNNSATSIDELNKQKVFTYYSNNQIVINLLGDRVREIELYTLNGSILAHQNGSNSDIKYLPTNNVAQGVYLISLKHISGAITTKKIFIK